MLAAQFADAETRGEAVIVVAGAAEPGASAAEDWQAALLEASYGYVLLTFNPFDGDGISQVQMEADTLVEADGMLRAYDEGQLQELLSKARPCDSSTGIFTPSS